MDTNTTEPASYSDIIKVRDALWRVSPRGGASVIVGAGFSRQAQPIAMDTASFPLWSDLLNDMREELGLDTTSKLDVRDVAQTYSDRFGKVALDDLILRSVPDEDYAPGDNHRRLLGLPWADVFTTNYDTLLERAARDIFDRRYEFVFSPEDIPLKAAPRIVKLHGSFPSHRPFVITRRHYDEYPVKRAPFVNFVRQSVMENVFILIGFSGDDPNFQAWTLWVQEQLGDYAPQIYLCGVLDLDDRKATALAKLRVTSIDLGPLFPEQRHPQRDARRTAALTWLLEVFAQGKPLRPTEWASGDDTGLPVLSPPAPKVFSFTPSTKSWPHSADGLVSIETLREVSRVWSKQREEYPGYLMAPAAIRHRIWHKTHYWRNVIFYAKSDLRIIERISLLRELVWRLDLCLFSLFTPEANRIADLLEKVNPFGTYFSMAGAEDLAAADQSDVAETWIELALSVLRTAREDLDEAMYLKWRGRLEALQATWPGLESRLNAEMAHWHLSRLDLAQLGNHLKAWRLREKTPLGKAKLAALFGELGDNDLAIDLAGDALRTIRKQIRAVEPQYALLSLESWLIQLLEMLTFEFGSKTRGVGDRMSDLRRYGCDPEEFRHTVEAGLSTPEAPLESERKTDVGFDPGEYRETRRLDGGQRKPETLIPAFAMLRLGEVVPVALRTNNVSNFASEVARAAVWLESTAPFWALAFIVRTGDADAIKRFMDRTAVALLLPERVDLLWSLLERPARFALSCVADHNNRRKELSVIMGGAALELLSRLAFRLSKDQLHVLLNLAVAWLNSDGVARSWHFDREIENLTKRIIYVFPKDDLPTAALQLLAVPMLHENDFGERQESGWPDPIDALNGRIDWPAPSMPVPDMLFDRLTYVLRHGDQESTPRALARLSFLSEKFLLSQAQSAALESALWSRTEPEGLPIHIRRFSAPMWISIPGAAARGIHDLIRHRLFKAPFPPIKLSDAHDTLDDITRRCTNIRTVSGILYPRQPLLSISESEANILVKALTDWWYSSVATLIEIRATADSRRIFFRPEQMYYLSRAIAALLGDVVLSAFPKNKEICMMCQRLLEAMGKDGFDWSPAYVGLFSAGLVESAETAEAISKALYSDIESDIDTGGWLVLWWYRCHARNLVTTLPPASLIELLVQRVALRSATGVTEACHWLATLIREFGEGFSSPLRTALERVLDALATSTDLTCWKNDYQRGLSDRAQANHIIEARTRASALAGCLYFSDLARGATISATLERWRKIAETDPLPEVRRAWEGVDP